jgi:hypothetical protein
LLHDIWQYSRGNFLLSGTKQVSDEKKQMVRTLYLSGIAEEFIALQLDLEIPEVITILKESGIYKGG